MPTEGHTREQPTTPTLMTNLGSEICRTCANPPISEPSNPRKSISYTPGRTDYRNPHRDPRSSWIPSSLRKQESTTLLSKPRGQDAAIHRSPRCGRLRDDAPKEEKDGKTPSLSDPPWKGGAHSTTTLSRKVATPVDAVAAGSDEDQSWDFSRRCANHLQATTVTHQSPSLLRANS
ncbi:hypothetical protein ZWY2020_023294 [Hordeum vulgare]|nr:hypothetical protein ZWY2020_023294 [Hordeum vulgare]